MKKIIFLILVLMVVNAGAQDRIFLKNGSIIKGLYSATDSVSMKIVVLVEGERVEIPLKIVDEMNLRAGSRRRLLKGTIPQKVFEPGFYNKIKYSSMLYREVYDAEDQIKTAHGLEAMYGYKWSRFLNAGIKTGIDLYGEFIADPVAAHYELDLRRGKLTPVILGDIGYGLVWSTKSYRAAYDDIGGGLHYSAGIGYKINAGSKQLQFSIQGRNQKVHEAYLNVPEDITYYPTYERIRNIRRVQLSAALIF